MQTVTIAQDSYVHLLKRVASLNKRAAKNNFKPIVVSAPKEVVKTVTKLVDPYNPNLGKVTRTYQLVEVTVDAEPPVIAGWKFVSVLQPEGTGVVIKSIGGEELPKKYRNAKKAGWCDHCKKTRYRLETFVLKHEDGRYIQVGRSCMKEFMPVSVDFAYLEGLTEGHWDELAEEDEKGGYRGAPEVFKVTEVLAKAVAAIKHFGFTPTKGDGWSTASQVGCLFDSLAKKLEHCKTEEARKAYIELFAKAKDPSPKMKKLAKEVAAACKAKKMGSTDYHHNLSVVCGNEFVAERSFGILVSAVVAYEKFMGKEVEKKKEKEADAENPSQALGKVGERKDWGTAEVLRSQVFDGNFGYTTLIVMIFNGRDRAIYWKSGNWTFERGEKFLVKATVKEVGTDKEGRVETKLTRGVLTSLVEVAEAPKKKVAGRL